MSDFGNQVRLEEYKNRSKQTRKEAEEAIENGEAERAATLLREAADAKEKVADYEDRSKVARKHRTVAEKWRSHADDIEQGRLITGDEGQGGSPSSSDGSGGPPSGPSGGAGGGRDDEENPLDITPQQPDIDFSDVGGMQELKEDLWNKIAVPLNEQETFQVYGVGSIPGVLLQGPPGTGKTHITKALAGELSDDWSFLRVEVKEIVSSYIGEGAKNLGKVFDIARENQPCILFFDEIDAVGSRGSDTSQTQSERQMLTTMLTEMNRLDDDECDVVIIGATNEPEEVDSALKSNSKRISEVIEVPMPDPEARKDILRIELEDVPLDAGSIDIAEILERTDGFSAADMAEVGNIAKRTAAREAAESDERVPVQHRHIVQGIEDRARSRADNDKGDYL